MVDLLECGKQPMFRRPTSGHLFSSSSGQTHRMTASERQSRELTTFAVILLGRLRRSYLIMPWPCWKTFGMYFAINEKPPFSLGGLKEVEGKQKQNQMDFRVGVAGWTRDLGSWDKLLRDWGHFRWSPDLCNFKSSEVLMEPPGGWEGPFHCDGVLLCPKLLM